MRSPECIHHALCRIPRRTESPHVCLRDGFGNAASAKFLADEGTQALIAGEEEEFVFLDRPAHHAAELLQLYWGLRAEGRGQCMALLVHCVCWVEEAARIPGGAAVKPVSRAVKRVGPRSDSHVHHGAGLPPVLRLGIFLDVEFLDG